MKTGEEAWPRWANVQVSFITSSRELSKNRKPVLLINISSFRKTHLGLRYTTVFFFKGMKVTIRFYGCYNDLISNRESLKVIQNKNSSSNNSKTLLTSYGYGLLKERTLHHKGFFYFFNLFASLFLYGLRKMLQPHCLLMQILAMILFVRTTTTDNNNNSNRCSPFGTLIKWRTTMESLNLLNLWRKIIYYFIAIYL